MRYALVLPALLSGCGGKLDCGEGTVEQDGECVAAEADADSDADADTDADVTPDGEADADSDADTDADTDADADADSDADSDADVTPRSGLSAGVFATCYLDDSGKADCWGPNEGATYDFGIPYEVPDETFVQIDVGGDVACGVLENGFISCWGDRDDILNDIPAEQVKSVGIGSAACALTEAGEAICWGDDDYGMISDAPSDTFTELVVGSYHACGLLESGAIDCWGMDEMGQTSPPSSIFGDVVELASAGMATCALLTSGEIECWGGERANPDDSYGEAFAPEGDDFVAVRAGDVHVCGIEADGRLICWGLNNYGQATLMPDIAYVDAAGGTYHTCGVTVDGDIECWGDNTHHQCDVD